MSDSIPRLRMFAGPNGSGKSTLKSHLHPSLLGVYLNPDEMEQQIRNSGFLDFSAYNVNPSEQRIRQFFGTSTLLQAGGLAEQIERLTFSHARVDFAGVAVNSYFASVAVELLRHELLQERISFTFETVMSHPSKIEFLAEAQALGFRTYLYFVATDDPEINISRVANRVKLNGHDVPKDKIVERYHRSLDLLLSAIRHTNRAYIFDNSGDSASRKQTWLAEITDGKTLELKTGVVPAWFQRAVLDKIK